MFAIQQQPAAPFIDVNACREWPDKAFPVVHCRFNTDGYHDALFQEFGILLPQSLQQAVVRRRAEFLAGRYCAARALQRLGIDQADVAIGPHRNPVWPDRVAGSISHCAGDAVAAVVVSGDDSYSRTAWGTGIGVDIEKVINRERMANIQHKVLRREELPLVSSGIDDSLQLFTIAFSIKESFFKFAYPRVGRYFDFDAVSLLEIDRESATVLLQINQRLHESLPQGLLLTGRYVVLSGDKVMTLIL